MSLTLAEMEQRLLLLEQEVRALRERLEGPPISETPAERGARMLREAKRTQAQLAAGWAKAMEQMGISGSPVPPEKLREMMAACGIKPEDNLFSRAILEMREE
jgi:hypothetical protein